MLKKFRNALRNPGHRRLFSNFFSLTVLQAANYLLPLLTLPYLTRVLGPNRFGVLAAATAFIQYFAVLIDYGFNLSASREISVHRDNPRKVSAIFNSVMTAKLLTAAAGFIVMACLVMTVGRFRAEWTVYFLTFLIPVGEALFPVWFYIGMERMKYITLLNFLIKTVFTASVFLFVRSSGDYTLVPVLQAAGYFAAGAVSLAVVIRFFRVRIFPVSLAAVIQRWREGWHIFLSGMSIKMYTTSNIFILSLVVVPAVTGIYEGANRICQIGLALYQPVYQVLYPYLIRLASRSKKMMFRFARTLLLVLASGGAVFWLVVFAFSEKLVLLVLGPAFAGSVPIFRVLSALLVINPVTHILMNVLMLSFRMDRYYSRIYLYGAAQNLALILVFLLVFRMGPWGVALVTVANEILMTLVAWIVLRRRGVDLVGGKLTLGRAG